MPLHIEIKINDTVLNNLHIARVKGDTNPDSHNDYLIIEGEYPLRNEDWYIDGVPFKHRYGDGAEVCVAKGIRALRGNGQRQKHVSIEELEMAMELGGLREQNRIIKRLQEYVDDVRMCHKDDSCEDIAFAIEEQIKEIRGDYN